VWQEGESRRTNPESVFRAGLLLAFVQLFGFGASACGQPVVTMTTDAGPRDVEVELGTGEAEFEPIEGEPTLEMAAGIQGGFHVWASLLARGFEQRELDVELVTTVVDVADSRLVMRPTLQGEQSVNEDGVPLWRFAGYPAQVSGARCAHGKRVHLQVVVSDSEGREASDERYCIVALDERYRTECE
jgi:hypothetical protein